MKKLLFLASLLLCQLAAGAQEYIAVDDFEAPQGKTTYMAVKFHFNADHDYVSYQFTVQLPDGLELVADDYGTAAYQLADNQPSAVFNVDFPAYNGIFKSYSSPSTVITASEGVLVTIPVVADESLEVGTTLEGKLSGVVFSHINAVAAHFADATFTVTIGEPRVHFDEEATLLPPYAAGKDLVTMKRTINAGEWSTICLPFTLTKAVAESIFGSDVELYKFTGYETTVDEETLTPTAISMNFTKYNLGALAPMTGGQPFLIKTSRPISEIKPEAQVTLVTDVKRNDVTDVNYDAFGGSFTGTFVKAPVPDKAMFISGNKFWYSAGKTTTKAFRGWFALDLVLNQEIALSRVSMKLTDGEATKVVSLGNGSEDNRYYDLQGRRMDNVQDVQSVKKGVYIRDGKKVVVK